MFKGKVLCSINFKIIIKDYDGGGKKLFFIDDLNDTNK